MVVVPVAAVNYSRPYLRGALILQAIAPLRELGSRHARLVATRTNAKAMSINDNDYSCHITAVELV